MSDAERLEQLKDIEEVPVEIPVEVAEDPEPEPETEPETEQEPSPEEVEIKEISWKDIDLGIQEDDD